MWVRKVSEGSVASLRRQGARVVTYIFRAEGDDRVLNRAALRRERPNDDAIDAGPGDPHDMINDFFDGPGEGERVDMAIGDQWQQR